VWFNAFKVTIHLHETEAEVKDSEGGVSHSPAAHRSLHKSTPLVNLNRLGLLTPRLIAAHMVHVNKDEARLFGASGCTAVHCPCSNLYPPLLCAR
jgi:5-methylthioadenosine/S-adenosylhomocysteine deaminase